MTDFDNMKSLQFASEIKISALTQAKADQDAMNQQLIETMTSVRVENENLKQELLTNFSTSGLNSCNCNSKNVTEELKDFKTNYRYMTLSLLDIQQKTDVMQGLSKIFVSTFVFMYQLKVKTIKIQMYYFVSSQFGHEYFTNFKIK